MFFALEIVTNDLRTWKNIKTYLFLRINSKKTSIYHGVVDIRLFTILRQETSLAKILTIQSKLCFVMYNCVFRYVHNYV